ncbi:cytochrome c biogenesis protein CcsA [Desulfurobacterium sp.]
MNLKKTQKFLNFTIFVILTVIEIYRTFKTGYPPIFSPFDSLLLLTAVFALISGLMETGIAGTILSIFLTIPLFFLPQSIKEIPPIIRTPLFIIHVTSAMVSYAIFLSLSVIALFDLKKKNLTYKKPLLLGFFLFSVSMVIGGIWAYLAWADLFPFEPKSLFSLFLWFYTAFLLHVETDKAFKEFKHYFIAAAGGFVLFSFFGINFLFGGTHGF